MIYVLSLSKLETVLAQTVGEYLNGEPQISWLCCISNAAPLSLKLLLSAGEIFLLKTASWFVF